MLLSDIIIGCAHMGSLGRREYVDAIVDRWMTLCLAHYTPRPTRPS